MISLDLDIEIRFYVVNVDLAYNPSFKSTWRLVEDNERPDEVEGNYYKNQDIPVKYFKIEDSFTFGLQKIIKRLNYF